MNQWHVCLWVSLFAVGGVCRTRNCWRWGMTRAYIALRIDMRYTYFCVCNGRWRTALNATRWHCDMTHSYAMWFLHTRHDSLICFRLVCMRAITVGGVCWTRKERGSRPCSDDSTSQGITYAHFMMICLHHSQYRYGVAMTSRLLKITGLFCKRAL